MGINILTAENVAVAKVERCMILLAFVMSKYMVLNLSECGGTELIDVCSDR